ncbi:UNVERIFIED_CONTAM: hypothetical protein GTU68_011128, partial [Idotea baltica]|nr:hypothetical protein [Idotea baltica]
LQIAKRSNSPSYRERFLFALEEDEALDRSLSFYMYATDKFSNTMVGEAQIKLADLDFSSGSPVELTLTDSGQQRGTGYGEIMFSLSYLPTAERLTVVVVKARSLQYGDNRESADPFVKVG